MERTIVTDLAIDQILLRLHVLRQEQKALEREFGDRLSQVRDDIRAVEATIRLLQERCAPTPRSGREGGGEESNG